MQGNLVAKTYTENRILSVTGIYSFHIEASFTTILFLLNQSSTKLRSQRIQSTTQNPHAQFITKTHCLWFHLFFRNLKCIVALN